MQKGDGAYTRDGILFSRKNEITLSAATWMELEIIILSQVSQTEKQLSYAITYMWNLKKNDTNELIYKTEIDFTDTENKFMVTKEEREGERIN